MKESDRKKYEKPARRMARRTAMTLALLLTAATAWAQPTNLTASNKTGNSVTMTWEAPTTDNTITGYAYQIKKSVNAWGTDTEVLDPALTSLSLDNLLSNTNYDFRVKALYEGGESSDYAPITIRTLASLPYTYNFETTLAAEGWTKVNLSDYDEANTVDHYFCFYRNGIKYLISPELYNSSGGPFLVSFYYWISYNQSSSIQGDCSLQMGYSTTTNDLDAFTWEEAITEGADVLYKAEVPANTKFIAIKSTIKNDDSGTNSLRNLSFLLNGCLPTENLTVTELTDETTTLTWEAPTTAQPITGYAYQFKKSVDSWEADTEVLDPALTSLTFDNLLPNTSYDFRVKALYGSNKASEYKSIAILTDCSMTNLPVTEDFENGLGCWRVVNGSSSTGYQCFGVSEKTYKHFNFKDNIHPQYFISPQFEESSEIKVSFTYCIGSENNPKAFQVGYSATDNVDDFTWGEEIHATNYFLDEWMAYEHTFSANTGIKYIAIKYNSDNPGGLMLDDFCIIKVGIIPPAQLTVSDISCESATLTWTAPATAKTVTGYAYQLKKAGDAWGSDISVGAGTTSATFNGLTADTDYEFRVKAIYGSDVSVYTTTPFVTATDLSYEMGFENGYGRWSMVDCETYFKDINDIWSTGRRTRAAHDSNVGFQFSRNTHSPGTSQYLISPRFAGDRAITLSFYYRVPTNIEETIYVGYSTTTSDKDAFTFGDAITFNSSNWTKYENTFPAEARFFAVKYTTNNYFVYIDDFLFEESSTYAKPTAIALSALTKTDATLVWDVPDTSAEGFAYRYKKSDDSTWSDEETLNTNTVTLSNLTPNTIYYFRVKALYAGNKASNYTSYNFLTEANSVSVPYTDDFENGMGGWRKKDCDGSTGIRVWDESYSGSYCFDFWNSDHSQYLISPQLISDKPIKASFYYRNSENKLAYFLVGYGSNKNAINWDFKKIIIASTGTWTLYEETFPAETQYVVIVSPSQANSLFLDYFSFTEGSQGVTFAKEGFSTFYDSQFDLTLPAGVKAYIVTASEGAGSLTYQAIADGDGATNTVPKGTAVMLRKEASDAKQTIDIPLASPTAAAISETNLLHGSDTEITTTGGDAGAKYYKLSYGTDQTGNGGEDLTGVLGWFWGAADGAAFTSAAHKAWLVLPSTAGTRGFFGLPGDDETTGIKEVKSEGVKSEESGVEGWFSLDGRRLNGRPSAKGLYIHNGSKVAIK